MADSNSIQSFETLNNQVKDEPTLGSGIKKLAMPSGGFSGYIGGGGSNGCVISGPYDTYIDYNDNMSNDSFESTEQTDAAIDSLEKEGLSHYNFQFNDVVWVKRPLLPWFPGIIINSKEITKEVLKNIGASTPTKDQLENKPKERHDSRIHLVYLFNRKKLWLWTLETKLRPFCNENDSLFLEKAKYYCTDKYKKDIDKAYKRAKKLAYPDDSSERHHFRDYNYLFRHLFHHNH